MAALLRRVRQVACYGFVRRNSAHPHRQPTATDHRESSMLITADTIVTGRELLRPGWIDVDRGSVRAIGAGNPPGPADLALGAVTVVPGFVDMHVHGGGGGAFPKADLAETTTAVDLHRRHGTT